MNREDKNELELLKSKVNGIDENKFNVRTGHSFEEPVKSRTINSREVQREKNKKQKRRNGEKYDNSKKELSKDELKFEPIGVVKRTETAGEENIKRVNDNKNKKGKSKKEKKPFSWKSFLLKLFICIVIASFVSILIFSYLDRFIYNLEHSNSLDTPIKGLQKEKDIVSGVLIDSSMHSVQYSYNAKYYTFLKDGKVYIYELATGKESAVIEAEAEICYYNLLYDKNLIFYVTKEEGAYSTALQIWTYEFSSKKTAEYNEFNFSGFVRVKDMEYSPVVNIIYLNIERNQNGYVDNVVYKIDLFNNMYRYATDMVIDKMVMFKKLDRIYFQEDDGTIYYQGYPLRIFDEGVDLIGIDYRDDVYLINESRSKIYVLDGRNISRTFDIPVNQKEDTSNTLITWYSNNTDVYLVYSTYILCISSDKPNDKVSKMSDYMTFVAIKGNNLILKTGDNKVITTKLK